MRLIDTHAHTQFKAFADNRDAVLTRAREAGVMVVNVGTHFQTSKLGVELAERDSNCYAVVGLHPVHTYEQDLEEEQDKFKTHADAFDMDAFRELAKHPKVVGIGECGLDYYRLPEGGDTEAIKAKQREAFVAQIELAKELDKALVIHCRPSQGTNDAYRDILTVLHEQGTEGLRFEVHSYTGSADLVTEFVDRGAYVGINGIATFDKTGNMARMVELVPMDRIVLETDCPYLAPAPHRGKQNEPSYVVHVAEKVAELKGLSVDAVFELTTVNAKNLFKFE